MTEYDYSPDAFERHMAKQDAIANWVDKTKQYEPTNPFAPIPGESPRHSDFYSPSPPETPPPQQTYGYPYSYQYQYPYRSVPHYPQQQMYYPSQPQPAFYATPQGVISPTYASMHVSPASRSHRSRRSSSRHSSGSRSFHPSSTSMPFQSMVLGSRSYSSPPSQTGQYFLSPTTSPNGGPYVMQMAHQQQLMQPVGFQQSMYPPPAGYPAMHSIGSTPSGSAHSSYYSPPQTLAQMSSGSSRGRSKSRSRSESYSHSHSSSHRSGRSKSRSRSYSNLHQVQAAQSQPPFSQVQPLQNPYGMAYGAHSTPYLQPTAEQPVVVPLNGGGYVIVPAAGQDVSVAPPQYREYPQRDLRSDDSDSDSERGAGGSFFGSLRLGRRNKKSRRHSRTGSY